MLSRTREAHLRISVAGSAKTCSRWTNKLILLGSGSLAKLIFFIEMCKVYRINVKIIDVSYTLLVFFFLQLDFALVSVSDVVHLVYDNFLRSNK